MIAPTQLKWPSFISVILKGQWPTSPDSFAAGFGSDRGTGVGFISRKNLGDDMNGIEL